MGSPSSPALDEAHCLWPLCTHTCCWEAEQRICKGKPRQGKALTASRASVTASEENRFPAITLVNASEWADEGSPFEVLPLKRGYELSEAAASTLISRVALPKGARRPENVQISNSSSATPSHLETHREKKTFKLRTVNISRLPSCTSTSQSPKPTVIWVPGSCYVPLDDYQHSVKSPRLAVKELVFLPSAEVYTSVENKKNLKQDKPRKRVLLKQIPLKSQLNQEGKGSLKSESDPGLSWPGSVSDRQVKKASAPPQVHRLVPVGQTLAAGPEAKEDLQLPSSAQTLPLRNNLMIFEPVMERMQRRHAQQEPHTSKYKLDPKTGMDGIDWQSLKRQTLLWRRHTQPVQCGGPSSSKHKADYVPCSLHPAPIPSSQCQSKGSSTTGPAKCTNLHFINGIWQSCCRFLASTPMDGPPRSDKFRFWFSTCFRQNPGQHTINAEPKSGANLHGDGTLPPPNSQQSSKVSSENNQKQLTCLA